MKAAVYYGVGDIRIEDVPKPECPKGGMLLKVEYVTTCGTDVKKFKRGHVKDNARGTVFGHECAGIVAEVDEGVTKFKVGDRVGMHNTAPCGHCYWCKRGQPNLCPNWDFIPGTYAEYVAISENLTKMSAFLIPDDMPLEVAPAIEPMSSATYCISQSGIQMGDWVAVIGAGPLGLGITRCATLRGGRVIICDQNAERLEVAKRMGAEKTVLVTPNMDQIQAVRDLTPDGRGADVAIEAVGLPKTWEMCVQMVRKGGTAVLFGGCKAGTTITIDTALLHYSEITIKGIHHTTPYHVEMAFDLLRRGAIRKEDIITGSYTLDTCVQALEDHANQIGVKNLIKIGES